MSSVYHFLIFLLKVPLSMHSDILLDLETTVVGLGNIAECIIDLEINLHFKPTLLIIRDKMSKDGALSENLIASRMFRHGIVVVLNDRPENLHNIFVSNIVVIIHLRNCESMEVISRKGFQDNWKYLIITTNFTSACKKYTDYIKKYSLADLAIINDDDMLNLTLWSYLPIFNESYCDIDSNVQATLINYCTKGTWKFKNMYPPKTPRDYKKCPLNVGAADMFPFSKVDEESQELKPIDDAAGSDVELIKIVSEFHNFTPKLWYVFKHKEDPGMSTRFVSYLINGSLDVCIGGFYRLFGDQVDYSGIYNRQVVRWVYPIVREQRHWTKFAKKLTTSYIFLLFYVCYAVVWPYVSRADDLPAPFRLSFTYGWGALMNSTGLSEARTYKQRVLNYCYLYMCMHFSAFLGAKLYSFLTIQAPGATFQTNDDVMESGRRPYVSNASRGFVDDAKFIAFVADAVDCLITDCPLRVLEHGGVTLVLSGFFPPIQTSTSVNYEATLMYTRDNVLTVYHEMLLRKDALFVDAFKDTILRLVESGIADHLYDMATGVTLLDKAETATKYALANSYQCEEGCAIALSQISGIFYVWAFGCVISVAALLMELYYSKRRREDVVL